MEITESTMETVEMSEIDGTELGAVIRYISLPKRDMAHETKALNTCMGDLYVIVNALYDYAHFLERAASEQGLNRYEQELFLIHASRCRKIAGKFSQQIGYDYEKALERCRKRRTKENDSSDSGMDGLEALVQKQRHMKTESLPSEALYGNTPTNA
ncbi:MAG: hypothetical protein HFE91_01605 [Acutalibacter sp.]|uniref:hypothetical protein n=1 Tax=Acutalibacter sp. TaxID=1918636 RepID=UPI00216C47E6|nr:hypothetical protein [Acutalibacter sp.]MCI9224146.1 hypothetical protein [Acutalibacter sp.]